MRRVVLVCWVLVAFASDSEALTVDGDRARLHAEQISSLYPRLEGSREESDLIDYIEVTLVRAGVDYVVRDFADADGGHSFSRVIEAIIPGGGDGTLMVVAPLSHDASRSRDEDGSASVAAALALAEAASSTAASQNLRVLFVGGDIRSDGVTDLGSRLFLADYFPDGPHALLYLTTSGTDVRLITGADGIVSPLWLVQRTVNATSVPNLGLDLEVEGSLNQAHRLGISSTPAPIGAFLTAGIPSLYLVPAEGGLSSPDSAESARTLLAFLVAWVDQFTTGIPEQWDRHYLQFQLGERLIVIREQFFVTVLVAVLLFTLLYALVFRRRFTRYLRTLVRNLWNLPLLFLLIFLFLSAATYSVNLYLVARDFPQMWRYYPLAYVGLKALLALFLFTVASQFLGRLRFSKNGSFYSAAALFVLFIDIVIFSVINISFGHYFIWAYLAAFLFSIVPSRFWKVTCMILSPVLLLQAAGAVINTPESGLTELLLSPVGDLVLSFVALPFLLMLMRLDFLFRHPVKGRRSFALRTISLVSGLGVMGMLTFVSVSSPFSRSTPQPVEAVETIDYPALERRLVVSSPAPLGSLELEFAGQSISVETTDNRWQTDSDILPDVLTARLGYEQFIDRERGELVIDAPQRLQTLSITLFSQEPIVLYDASFPFTISADRRTAEIYVGDFPPLPLAIDYTVGGTLLPGIEIRASSISHPNPVRVEGRPLRVSSRLEIVTRFEQ